MTLRLFQEISAAIDRQGGRPLDRDFILETLVLRLPFEDCRARVRHLCEVEPLRSTLSGLMSTRARFR